jgi:hypothetical protein
VSAHTFWVLLRHMYRLWRGGQIRFRLETFGVYYPRLPYSAPWWKISPRVTLLLLRRLPAYARWVEEMEDITVGGAPVWWVSYRERMK